MKDALHGRTFTPDGVGGHLATVGVGGHLATVGVGGKAEPRNFFVQHRIVDAGQFRLKTADPHSLKKVIQLMEEILRPRWFMIIPWFPRTANIPGGAGKTFQE